MAYSYVTYAGQTGVVTDYAVPFGYLNVDHVTATVDGVSASFTWVNASLIRMDTAPVGKLIIKRTTPRDDPQVTFVDGSTHSASKHNTQNLQLLYIAQEDVDLAASTIGLNDAASAFDARGLQIKDVADPTDDQDAATKVWVEAQDAAVAANIVSLEAAAAASANAAAASANAAAVDAAGADAAFTNANNAMLAAQTAQGAAASHAADASTSAAEASDAVASGYNIHTDNKVINGTFTVAQRGTSHAANGYGSLDRWAIRSNIGSVLMTQKQDPVFALDGYNVDYYMRFGVSGQVTAGDYMYAEQRIENVKTYSYRTVTVMGWARRNSGTGDMAVEFQQNFGTGGSLSVDIEAGVMSLTTDWQPFAFTVLIPPITFKTVSGYDDYLALRFYASSDAFVGMSVKDCEIDLWGVHIRLGDQDVSSIGNYFPPKYEEEFAKCQRYLTVLSNADTGGSGLKYAGGAISTMFNGTSTYPGEMRALPTLTATGTFTFTNCASSALQSIGTTSFTYRVDVTAAGPYRSTGAYFLFDAEL